MTAPPSHGHRSSSAVPSCRWTQWTRSSNTCPVRKASQCRLLRRIGWTTQDRGVYRRSRRRRLMIIDVWIIMNMYEWSFYLSNMCYQIFLDLVLSCSCIFIVSWVVSSVFHLSLVMSVDCPHDLMIVTARLPAFVCCRCLLIFIGDLDFWALDSLDIMIHVNIF